ncbi:MAG: sigma-70 family RNA polymerase sigma factor [Planctomycetaceae bacterium]|jgi:RNA polymerase sigma-70 factor (ECF subfamily)|nr:sigma-70 family RNA polymerase sigma factor [Planctomycetaceae bacterium]
MYCVAEKTSRFSVIDFSQWTDEELILEYRLTQQREAFEELIKRYERELFNYLRHYLGNTESAEDIFQTTFLQVLTKCDQFEEGRKFRPWLYRIATNQAIDFCRKMKRYQVVSIDETCDTNSDSAKLADMLIGNETDPVAGSISGEQTIQVRKAVERLPDFLRQVLYMVYFQGMSYRDAAESLGIPFGTIKSRLNTAVKKLNHLLADSV